MFRRKKMKSWPIFLKIDISPLCNLKCVTCVHSQSTENSNNLLKTQCFNASQKMSLEQYKRIIDEIKGKTSAVSMYYMGDPFIHPDLDEMCKITWQAGLNSHVNTNLSFILSDDRINSIVTSGLTHLTVCVDGLSQENYSLTRVGGRIDVVLDNLERILQCRRKLGRIYPKVEVQYIKFQHNVDELEEAIQRFEAIGVDQISDFWGSMTNCTEFNPACDLPLQPKKSKTLPQCSWPYFAMLIKYNGDVIPCCNYRIGPQYSSDSTDQCIIGNVFKTGVWEVWNSAAYQKVRQFVLHPVAISKEIELKRSFCAGCHRLYITSRKDFMGDVYRWEDLFEFDDQKRVVRKKDLPQQVQSAD